MLIGKGVQLKPSDISCLGASLIVQHTYYSRAYVLEIVFCNFVAKSIYPNKIYPENSSHTEHCSLIVIIKTLTWLCPPGEAGADGDKYNNRLL